MNDEQLFPILRELLGKTGRHQGDRAQVIDLMLDPPTLVIRGSDDHGEIQLDVHGRPRSRAARLWQIPVYLDGHDDRDGLDARSGENDRPRRLNPNLLPWLNPSQATALDPHDGQPDRREAPLRPSSPA